MKKFLTGHTSPETAFVVDDYPYGFRLRCQIRYWLEHCPKKGTRFCSQTTNPKVLGTVWNKPKKSTYCMTGVMFADEKGHVQWTTANHSDETAAFRAWLTDCAAYLDEVALSAAARHLTLRKAYDRLKAAGLPYQHAGQYAVLIGAPRKDGSSFTTTHAIAAFKKHMQEIADKAVTALNATVQPVA